MYETVKIVNGYEITRMVGTRRFYHISDGYCDHIFHTIKAAAEWAAAN